MPIGQPTPIHICQEILLRFDEKRRQTYENQHGKVVTKNIMRCCKEIGREMDPPMLPETVHGILMRLRPTTDIAKMYLKAKAYKLVRRLVKRANPAEIIDVLTRPGIGVLEPQVKMEGSGGGGFFLSVSAESLGAVKIGVGQMPNTPKVEALQEFNPFVGEEDDGEDDEKAPIAPAPRLTSQSALERARAKLYAAQQAARGGDGSPEDSRHE